MADTSGGESSGRGVAPISDGLAVTVVASSFEVLVGRGLASVLAKDAGVRILHSERSWETVRNQLKELYVAGEAHRAMALRLNLTKSQVHTRLHRLFRE